MTRLGLGLGWGGVTRDPRASFNSAVLKLGAVAPWGATRWR